MKKGFCILLILSSMLSYANLNFAPTNFSKNGRVYVFVDFKKSLHRIIYDSSREVAWVESEIEFVMPAEGHPLWDLTVDPTEVFLNDQKIGSKEVKLPNSSTMRSIEKSLSPGEYTIKIKNKLSRLVNFYGNGVVSAFWMSDLNDRSYLERYIPVNLEYDQYQKIFDIKFLGIDGIEQRIYTNGEVTELGKNHFQIVFPDFYSVSSLFYHTAPKGRFSEQIETIKSIDGRSIEITVYSKSSTNSFMRAAKKIFAELENDYGVWPHPRLLIYAAGQGGMEYSGATMTSMRALGHEMHHAYFARGMTPSNGNSGWMDEALASWRDNRYPSRTRPGFSSTDMAGHSEYRRFTDRRAYSKGANFMAYLDKMFQSKGGLRKFLKDYASRRMYTIVDTKIFKEDLEKFYNKDLSDVFSRYIYGKRRKSVEGDIENPMHPVLTEQQLEALL